MLSRIADSLYWMMRYTERAGSMLRVLRIQTITSLDRGRDFSWEPVLHAYTQLPEAERTAWRDRGDEALHYVLCDRTNGNALRHIIGLARENARGMQDHITKEVWESLNALYHKINGKDMEDAIGRGEQIVLLSELYDRCLLFNGVIDGTMPRGLGWHYMSLGKYLERGLQTLDAVDMRFRALQYDLEKDTDIPHWRALLLSLSGYEMYLKRYHMGFQGRSVADLALLNLEFPRSVLYCIHRIEQIMGKITQDGGQHSALLHKQIGRMRARVEYVEESVWKSNALPQFLGLVRQDFYEVNNLLGKTHFAYQ